MAKSYKHLIGKKIQWEITIDANRGYYKVKEGTVDDTKYGNILVDGNWEHANRMENIKIIS